MCIYKILCFIHGLCALTVHFLAVRLYPASVYAEIYVSSSSCLAVVAGVGVQHVHGTRAATGQADGGDHQRPGRI